ncbi:hypothetical protein [Pirellula sp. SH-Sr6A]|uniref:hypothetical protein n=1 Tax=Pirellula sp. SH-Sr6A TaxID=1632865 RepID=UPI0011BA77CD|nr:hypothetical protein [Pirellula sp. SH-Sr6A]
MVLRHFRLVCLASCVVLCFVPLLNGMDAPVVSDGEASALGDQPFSFPEPSGSIEFPGLRETPDRETPVGRLINLEDGPDMDSAYVPTGRGDELELPSAEHFGQAWERYPASKIFLPRLRHAAHHPYTEYRQDESTFSYLPGTGDELGWIDFESTPYQSRGQRSGISTGMGMHLLAGPVVVDAPPRVYDFSLGYQRRDAWNDFWSYDVAASVGVFSDFEGSARDGVRFPGHAVGMLHVSPETDWVFGIDYLDRGDIKILPVVGISRHSERHPSMRFDLVFPRPQVELALGSGRTFYVAGRLGGGTWDVEFPDGQGDVLTYRDYRLLFGLRSPHSDCASSIEVGYVFGRKMEFETESGVATPDDAFVLRFVTWR